jgi:biotin transport system substrate-specific component
MVRTYADLVCPNAVRRDALIRDGALVLAGSVVVALCAKIQFPSLPIPVTMQPFAVLLVGAVLGSRRGALALLAYLLEGAAGLPVFALPSAGLAYFAGPTAGYLFAFPVAAYVVGYLAERGWDRRVPSTVVAMAAGSLIILSGGFAWMAPVAGAKEALAVGVVPFLLGDVLKIALAALALPAGWRLLKRFEGPAGSA